MLGAVIGRGAVIPKVYHQTNMEPPNRNQQKAQILNYDENHDI